MEIPLLKELRINVKFMFKLALTGPEIIDKLQLVYGSEAVKRTTVFKWLKRFREGQERIKDDARSGRPSLETAEVKKVDGTFFNVRVLSISTYGTL